MYKSHDNHMITVHVMMMEDATVRMAERLERNYKSYDNHMITVHVIMMEEAIERMVEEAK